MWWHFWNGPGDLATWVTTLAVGGVAWELASGARRRVRDQASQIQIYAAENRAVGGVFINGDRLDHFTHEVHLRNGSAQPIHFPHVVLSTTSRFRWPWLRHRKVSRGPLVPYDQREGVAASDQEADRLCNIENGC